MPLKAFYGSRFSQNMTKTPEGFLVCHNVPISRSGWFEYLGQELNLNDMYGQIVKVYRPSDEVFNDATMASFESKSATDEHPPDDVMPDNYSAYEKGHVTNVRRGSGSEDDLLLADLVIKDPVLISEIEAGKREVSAGFSFDLVIGEDGTPMQTQIRGNHAAIVTKGRAGPRVSIKDNAPIKTKKLERSKPMSKKDLVKKWLGLIANDESTTPEEVLQAADMLSPGAVTEPPKATDEGGDIGSRLDKIEAILAKLVESDNQVHSQVETDALGELETELEKEDPEASKTVPADVMDADPEPEDNKKDEPIVAADRATVLAAIKELKPFIALIPDQAERKKAADALAKTFKQQLAPAGTQPDGYAGILSAVAANRAKAQDSDKDDPGAFGRNCAKMNPHSKKQ